MGGKIKNSRKTTRHLARLTGVSSSTARKICYDDCVFLSVHKSAASAIVGICSSDNLRFCEGVLRSAGGSPDFFDVTCFSNEAHFHLDCYINKKNVRFRVSENPSFSVVNLLQPEVSIMECIIERRSAE
jgi:hypothetical protein